MRPRCSTTNRRERSPGVCRSTGRSREEKTRSALSAGCPVTGVAEQAPDEGVGSGVGDVASLDPPQAQRQAKAPVAAARRAFESGI